MALETTVYGKIVGIETWSWGLHVQTDFAAKTLGCPVNVGDTYMYDFRNDNALNSPGAKTETAALLSALATGQLVSFHLYNCNGNNSRPVIGYVRMK